MTKPEFVYGVYQVDELNWKFFEREKDAAAFKAEDENRFGPQKFFFEEAIQQFSNDHHVVPATPFVTEEEFIEILNGEDLELSFLISGEPDSRVEPSEGYFEGTDEALLWLRACCVFILNHLQEYAKERDGVIEDFDYYDGFLSRLEVLVDDYLGDIEDFERILASLYDGVIDTDAEEYD